VSEISFILLWYNWRAFRFPNTELFYIVGYAIALWLIIQGVDLISMLLRKNKKDK